MSFAVPIQVPYYQVDRQGVVFNMWYLGWFDDAMSAFLGSLGHSYERLIASGTDAQVVHTEIDWNAAAHYGDDVLVEVSVASLGTTSFTLTFAVRRASQLLATGRSVYVAVDASGIGSKPIPPDLRSSLESARQAVS
jgi:acyl-CoA thioester hydrolase